MSVTEYLHEFNRLARYAPEDVRSDTEKQEKFLFGLDDELTNQLISGVYEDFEKLVDKAIRQEEQRNKMDRKRKAAQISFPQGNNQKPRFMTGQLGGPSTLIVCQHRPYHPSNFDNDYNGGSHNNSKQHNHNSTPPPLMAPAQSDPPAVSVQSEQPKEGAVGKPAPCFNCGKHDHFACKCPKLNRTRPRFIQARANHVSAEEAQAAPEVVLGTFPVNSYPATVLFDSGASHSFISKRFAGTHGLSVVELKIPMQVHTPGNDMRTAHYCPSVTIEIKGSPFLSNLILLESKDLDVILGMDWLTRNKGVIDCASRTITLTNDEGEKITFRSPASQRSVASLNQAAIEGQTETVEKSPRKLEDIPIVQEYPEVFPEDLTTMPPKREIEFRIDLAPGTAPIYKRPYRMAANELAEVKKQRVKAEHQRPAGLLQPLQIPEWKWEEIGMDFITGLPRTSSGHDSIWVVVDRLTKVAHFIPVHTTYTGKRLAELYLSRIMCLHGVPKKIVSDRGSQFTSKFWQKLQEELGTRLNFSTAYHPQTDGQTERVNQILEDMLRACALDFGGAWDKSLPYAEFSYNNSYQSSLQMAPFEALYGRKCRTPLFWDQTGERQLFGTEVLTEAEEKVRTVRERLRIAQSRQKSYADNRRRELTFEAGDYVYLRVTPLRGVHRFQTKGKLAPRFVGPYRILERRGEVAYQLELPSNMVGIHDVFHVSQLKKCLRVPEEQASSEHIDIQEDLTYVEKPICILETSERRTRNKVIKFCKVQWSHHSEEEATWEREDELSPPVIGCDAPKTSALLQGLVREPADASKKRKTRSSAVSIVAPIKNKKTKKTKPADDLPTLDLSIEQALDEEAIEDEVDQAASEPSPTPSPSVQQSSSDQTPSAAGSHHVEEEEQPAAPAIPVLADLFSFDIRDYLDEGEEDTTSKALAPLSDDVAHQVLQTLPMHLPTPGGESAERSAVASESVGSAEAAALVASAESVAEAAALMVFAELVVRPVVGSAVQLAGLVMSAESAAAALDQQ
ncbi:uncharacterized protein [Oryza sativa Japonica Group]|uniref:uncharacterized protein n=1 Tax=Oryza sativa subsp. japonica TaxID=39947 RepID=UPI00339BCACA